jgi:hypothetical protein
MCDIVCVVQFLSECCYILNVTHISVNDITYGLMGKDKIGSCTYDTLYIKEDNSVAVSSGVEDKRCITIINIENKKVMATISMYTDICGMAIKGRTIYYSTWSGGLTILNLSDKSASHIINREMCYVNYVATL